MSQLLTTHYELGGRFRSDTFQCATLFKATNSVEGVLAWARDDRTGEYVRIYEVGPTEWVQNEPQSYSRGNFETKESARKFARMAYRYLNKGTRR